MSDVLRFEWNDDGSQHGDLKLTLGPFEHVADSYYFAIDGGIDEEDESPKKALIVMRVMLDAWVAVLRALADGSDAHLPFDFSDQCTGWLHVRRTGERVTVRAGWSKIEGWSFNPSDFSDVRPTDFEDMPGSSPVETSMAELVGAIEASRDALRIGKTKRTRKRWQ